MSNKSVHTFQKGMVRIDNPTKQPDDTYSFALNIVPNNNILDNTSRSNEKGFDDFMTLKSVDYNIIGYQWLGNNEYIFFIKHKEGQTAFNEIIYANKDTNTIRIVYSNLKLNFQDNKEISSTYRINYKNQRILYWVDGLNADRVLNIDNSDSGSLDIDLLSIESSAIKPIVNATILDTGGGVTAGQYFIAVSYNLGDTFTTSPLVISNPLSIAFESYFPDVVINEPITTQFAATDGDIITTPTSKAISINVSSLDSNYDSYNLLIIKPNTTGFTIKNIKSISMSTTNYIYTGSEGVIDDTLNIANIIVDTVKYYASEAIIQKGNRLIRGNSKLRGNFLDYQAFANNIVVNYKINETKVYVANTPGTEGVVSDKIYNLSGISPSYLINTANDDINNKSFMRDEIYSLGIGFELIDGSETDVFHIPGRTLNSIGTSGTGEYGRTITSSGGQWDNEIINSKPYWKERNTAINDGTLAYWRSDLTYKDNFKLPTNGEKDSGGKSYIRHHKMPSDILEPIFRTEISGSQKTIYKRNIELQFNNIVIPEQLKGIITKIKFFYTPREGSNKSILTKGLAHICNQPNPTTVSRTNHFNKGWGAGDQRDVFEFFSPDITFKFKNVNISGTKIKVCGIDKADITYLSSSNWVKYFNNDLYDNTQRQQSILNVFGIYTLRAIPKSELYTRKLKRLSYVDSNFKGAVGDLSVDFAGGDNTSLLQVESPLTLLPSGTGMSLQSYYPTLNYNGNNVVQLFQNDVRYLNFGYDYDRNYDRMKEPGFNILDGGAKYDTSYYISVINENPTLYGHLEQLTYTPISSAKIYNGTNNIVSFNIRGGDTFIDMHHFKKIRNNTLPNRNDTAENEAAAINLEGVYNKNDGYGEPKNVLTKVYEDASQSFGSFICETDINIRMRREGTGPLEKYYPKSMYATSDVRGISRHVRFQDFAFIDLAYLTNYIKLYFSNLSNDSSSTGVDDVRYSTRVIYSDRQELEDKIDNYRTVKPNNYRDLPLNRGPIGIFFSKQDKLYAITRDSLFDIFASNQTIKTENEDNIVVGTGEFLSLEPTEVISITGGFGGSSSKWSISETPYGYLFVDKLKNKVLLFNDQLKDINILGLNEDFDLEFYKQFPALKGNDATYDDPIKGIGILSIYDPKLNRVLITKRDYKATPETFSKYKGEYDGTITYQIGDIISMNGFLYSIEGGESEISLVDETNFSTWSINNTNVNSAPILIINNPTHGIVSNQTNISVDYILNTGTTDSFTINQSNSVCAFEQVNISEATYNIKWIPDNSTTYCVELPAFTVKWIVDPTTAYCETF